ncbi:hypothetical protein [Streptomyces abyssomicinicus]|uniref:hypothetical protein n=1 Tax=Streptomyces abyssomicinicus TaxID=574929 RepID=UPI00124FFFBE|nr:hypothetical protein [Streptomyces abyssomicinicus]
MASWLEKLERREAAAREQIAELRDRIEELSGCLAEQETTLSRLEITRETMSELLDDGDDDGPATGPESGGPAGSPVGVRLIPDWSPELEVTVLPRVYQDIVEVLGDAVHPLRAHQLCSVLGLPTDKSKVEGFRSKLKRMVERGWLTEAEPGLFAVRSAPGTPPRAPGAEPSAPSSPSRR